VQKDNNTGMEYISFASLVSAATGGDFDDLNVVSEYDTSYKMTPKKSMSLLEKCKKEYWKAPLPAAVFLIFHYCSVPPYITPLSQITPIS
jgi:hypothetical protein